jgi:hypothetical protein
VSGEAWSIVESVAQCLFVTTNVTNPGLSARRIGRRPDC